MNNIFSRRQMIAQGLGGLVGLSALGLVGCDTSSVTTAPLSDTAVLQMIFWGSTTRNQLTRQAIDLFHKSNPNDTITSQYMGIDKYWSTLDAMIARGKAPDLIQMDMRFLSSYVRKGELLDLTPMVNNLSIDLSDFDPLLLDSSKANNTIYGVPLGGNYQCMYYDKSVLADANIGTFPEDMDWNFFAQYTTEISKAFAHSVYGTSDMSGDITTFEVWIRQHGGEIYTPDGNLNMKLENVTDWYNYWNDLRKAGGCLPTSTQLGFDNTNTPTDSSMIKGKVVFNFFFSNTYEAFQKASAHPLGLIMMPKGLPGSTVGMYLKTSQTLSVAATTAYPTEAARFLNFIVNDAGAVKALGIERGVPGSAQALTALAPQLTSVQQTIMAYFNFVAKSGNARGKVVLDPPGAGQVATLLKQTAHEIGLGHMSVTDGAKSFYTAAQKALV